MKAIAVCFALSIIFLPVPAMQGVVSAADPGDDGVKTFETLKTAYKAQEVEFFARAGRGERRIEHSTKPGSCRQYADDQMFHESVSLIVTISWQA